jgi:hypothetical protein
VRKHKSNTPSKASSKTVKSTTRTHTQPTLESKSKATAELLVKVAADQKEAELVKKNVAVEEKDVKVMQGEIQVGRSFGAGSGQMPGRSSAAAR